VTARFTVHAEDHELFPARQSAYRQHHSTETVVVSVLNDVIRAADEGKVTCLVLYSTSVPRSTLPITTFYLMFSVVGFWW